jgi:hypothetical protein
MWGKTPYYNYTLSNDVILKKCSGPFLVLIFNWVTSAKIQLVVIIFPSNKKRGSKYGA